ncbi:ROK family transcriptional regulator [Streptomyces cocklensis]|uniref:Transcriptional regulator n=1 Tax=Actinacidiphila cocklensis TaxID=887465 RepID=A0A9W4GWY0_9ACTN|nr:ROK family transcriptional regulator [Actinacidiphila cocklensis]MDD1059435.1 ROK family transcriptional regulator [Actinacidiphila cocklensis]CAG6398185.1 Transcriptional regulator [Actinacidiphila cocklensis]
MTETPSGGDLSQLRRLNSLMVIRELRSAPTLTLTELSRRTGLSRASTEDVVRELLENGWLAEVPAASGMVGRPARRFRFRADAGRVLGVDIGGHKILALVADLEGTVLHSARVAVAPAMRRMERLAALDGAVAEALAGAGLTTADLWATGVATTGLVDGAGRVMLSEALPEWTGVDVGAHLRRLVGGPALVENDSKLAALAESWCGAARYAKDVVVILAGLRTGAGLIIDGKLHRGFGNAAGEIGALPASGWIRAQEHLRAWPPQDGPAPGRAGAGRGADPHADKAADKAADQEAAAEAVFEAARAGDRKAAAVVRRYVRDVAVGAAALVLTLDPELVVVGGGFSRSADLIAEPLRRELDRWCIRTPEVRISEFGDEGVALGALRLALDYVDRELRERRELGDPEHFSRRV